MVFQFHSFMVQQFHSNPGGASRAQSGQTAEAAAASSVSLVRSAAVCAAFSSVMGSHSARFGSWLLGLLLLVSAAPPLTAWDADLELLDLVEEIPQTFYQFLNLDQVGTAPLAVSMVTATELTLAPRTLVLVADAQTRNTARPEPVLFRG